MAKINLGLDVLRRRENGYHDVKMIMQTVNLYDEITIEKSNEEGIVVSVDHAELPVNEDNLIYKSAKLMYEKFDISKGVHISLHKNIPIAAGMAGGSTDAAATFVGMNRLFGLGAGDEELEALAVKVGADVPYCLHGGTYLSEGIGEKLTKIEDAPNCYVVIAKPEISVSTKFVYENLHANELKYHPDIDSLKEKIQENDLFGMVGYMENVLETVTEKTYPIIGEIKQELKDAGALHSLMSGSGPTVFALFEQEEVAKAALLKIREKGLVKQSFCTTFIKETCIE